MHGGCLCWMEHFVDEKRDKRWCDLSFLFFFCCLFHLLEEKRRVAFLLVALGYLLKYHGGLTTHHTGSTRTCLDGKEN